jgi:hypothetical protein
MKEISTRITKFLATNGHSRRLASRTLQHRHRHASTDIKILNLKNSDLN